MFEKFCTRLSLHTRVARIAFFSSLIFILSITLLGIVFLSETPSVDTPQALLEFDPARVEDWIADEFGAERGEELYAQMRETVAQGFALMQGYQFLQGDATLTAEQARAQVAELEERWQDTSGQLSIAEEDGILALAEDVDEAVELAKRGLNSNIPYINRSLSRARGMFYDLNNVILAEEKSENYYGETRFGQLVETTASP